MRLRFYFLTISICLINKTYSQNLVPNGDFEQSKPQVACYIDSCLYWYNGQDPNIITFCPPMYFSTKAVTEYCSTPSNPVGFQYPRSKNAYASLIYRLFCPSNNCYRSYLSVGLKDSLVNGKTYCMNFYVSNVDSLNASCYIDAIEAYIHKDSILSNNGSPLLNNYHPQIRNPKGNIITDTVNWVLVSGTYTATGGEKYITIGTFSPDDSISYIDISGLPEPYNDYQVMYYIDDVSLYECNTQIDTANAGKDTIICSRDSVVLGTHNLAEYEYSWFPKNGLNDSSLANPTAKPLQTTTYYLKLRDFKYDYTYDSVTVTVFNCDTVKALVCNDTSLCIGDSVKIGGSYNPLYQYTWQPSTYLNNQNASNPVAIPLNSITYYLTVKFLSRTVTDSVKIDIYNCDTIKAFAGKDTSICLGDTVFLGKSSVPVCSYNWQPTTYLNNSNISNPYTLPNNTITYYLYLNIPNHQTKKDSIKINVYNCDTVKAKAINDTSLCIGDSVKIGGSSNPLYQYAWQPPLYLNNSTISNPVSKPQNSINYVLSVKFLRVTRNDTVKLTVYNCDSVIAEAGKDTSICPNSSVKLGTQSNPLFKYSWQPAEYLSNANIANPLAVPLSTTMYYVTVKFLSRTAKDSVKITIKNCDTTEIEITIPNVITPNNDGRNDEFIITGLPEYSNLKIFNRWGKTIYESNNYQNNYNFLEVPDGTYYFILTTPKNKIYKGIITIIR